jgi:hypothetical protein
MRRNLVVALFLCFNAMTGFAQGRLDGKWETDRPADPLTTTAAQRKQSAQLEVTTEGARASGTLNLGGLGGTFYIFQGGIVTGNKVQFRTDSLPPAPMWTIEMVDDNTVMLYRGGLPLVGNNVLDLISVLGRPGQPASPVQVGAVTGPPVSPSATIAQGAATASIRGIIQDQSKALVPGVTVTATNIDTGVKLTAVTNDTGLYLFPSVVPGAYTMTASLPGFKTTTVSNLSIGDAEFVQDLTLEFPTPQASVNPTAASCSGNSIVWCALLHRAK